MEREQTTEERIAEIARGFAGGIQNYQQQSDRQRDLALAEEAQKRQRALQAIQTAGQLTQQTGRMITPDMVQPILDTGNFSGFAELANQAPASLEQQRLDAQLKRQQEMDDLRRRRLEMQINQGTTSSKPMSYKEQLQIKKLEKDLEKQNDPLEKLGSETKKMVGIANEGLNAVLGMTEAFDSGVTPSYINPDTPFIGSFISDDAFTSNQRTGAEMFGRLQSGGAINKDEEARFVAMGPRPGDSPEIARQKLQSQKAALEDRLKILGITPEVLQSAGVTRRASIPSNQPKQAPAQVQRITQMAPQATPAAGATAEQLAQMAPEQRQALRQQLLQQREQLLRQTQVGRR